MYKLIGIFGGTFDPIHSGHVRAISMLCESLTFERVNWVVSAQPPHKHGAVTSAEHRFAMLKLALADYDHFVADDSEMQREQKSYTIYTARAFREQNPDASIVLIIGGDNLSQLYTWHRYQDLMGLVNIVVMNRPGIQLEIPSYLADSQVTSVAELSEHRYGKLAIFEEPSFAVSSTQIRGLFSQRLNIDSRLLEQTTNALISPAVLKYIQEHQLYKPGYAG